MRYSFYLFIFFISLVVSIRAYAESINYKQVLSDALGFSQKLSEAKLDQDIKESTLKEAAYLKYPELTLKIYSQQVKKDIIEKIKFFYNEYFSVLKKIEEQIIQKKYFE